MAKTISDEQMKLSIIINGNAAQKELFDLEKSTRSLTEANKGHLLQKQLLEKQGKKDTEQYKLLTATMKQNNAEITSNKGKMKELQNQIGVTGLTMKQLSDKARLLRMSLLNAVPGSEAYKKYTAELDQVNGRLTELKGKSNSAKRSMGSLADSFNRYQGMALAAVAAFTGMALSIQKILDYNGKLADAQSDVQKTTKLTKIEVDELTKSFGLFKTRTARIELLALATEAGRLGIEGVDNVKAFVVEANKLKVALGDDLSDEAIREVGKMVNVYKVGEATGRDFAGSMDALGSSINEVSASGANQASFLVDYLKRQAGIASQAKLSAANNIGYAATFDEIGQSVEVAATAMNKIWMDMFTNPSDYAKIAKMTISDFNKLLTTDSNAAMIKFLEGLKGNSGGLQVMLEKLDGLDVGGARGVQALSALANSTELLKERQLISNKALIESNSLTNEATLKEENLNAVLIKIQKTLIGWFSSKTFIEWLTASVDWIAKFIGATEDADGKVTAWKNNLVSLVKILTIVTVGMFSYRTAIQLVALFTNGLSSATTLLSIAQKANALSGGILKAVYTGLQYIFYTLTIQTDKATIAQERFNLATKMNPIGLVVGLLMAAVAAYVIFSKEIDKSIVKQQNLNDVRNSANAAIVEEKSNLENLLSIAKDETQTKINRENAIKRINEISPEFLKNITLETINTLEAKKAIDSYLVSLDKKAMKEAFLSKRSELAKKVIEAKGDKEKSKYGGFFQGKDTDFNKTYDIEKANIEKFKSLSSGWNSYKMDAYNEYKNSIIAAEDELKSLSDEEKKFISANTSLYVAPITPDLTGAGIGEGTGDKNGGSNKNPNSTHEEINKLKLDEQSKYNDLFLKQQRQLEDDRIATMQDGYEKELLIENQRYKREIDDLDRQKVHTDELAKIDEDISKAKEAKDITKYNELLSIRKAWDKKNADLDNQINTIKEGKLAIHNVKLGIIQEKGATDIINKRKEEFDRDKILRETKFNEQLAALVNDERAKEKLREEYNANEIISEEQFLKELLGQFNTIISDANFEGIDLSLLSPEEVDNFKKEAEKIGLILSQLGIKKGELSGKKMSNAESLGIAKGETDLFGFTEANWKKFYDNVKAGTFGVDEMVFAVAALVNMWGKYNQIVTNNENKQLQVFEKSSDTKKTKLKSQLDSGVINQSQYEKSVAKIDAELDKKKADLSYKQAKRERMIAISSAISGTAMAVVGALGNTPWSPFNFVLAGLVGAMGLLQLGTIMSQPLPAKGHEQGLYPEYVKREQDGKTFKSQYQGKTRSGLVSKTSHFLVAENGPEMVIDNKAWTQMDPAVKDALVRDLRGIKGFEQGYYNQDLKRYEVPASSTSSTNTSSSSSTNNDQMLQMMIDVVSENTAVMKDLRDRGVVGKFFKNDLQSAKNIQDSIKDYNELRNNSKK
jgi:TP901 family phage tail tape measure protein